MLLLQALSLEAEAEAAAAAPLQDSYHFPSQTALSFVSAYRSDAFRASLNLLYLGMLLLCFAAVASYLSVLRNADPAAASLHQLHP